MRRAGADRPAGTTEAETGECTRRFTNHPMTAAAHSPNATPKEMGTTFGAVLI
jgi:hypothetical protein